MSLATPYLHDETKEVIQIFGTDKDEWEKVIFSLVPRDQLRPQFGGTYDIDNDD
jgi:hypothetical protein